MPDSCEEAGGRSTKCLSIQGDMETKPGQSVWIVVGLV